MSIQFNGRAGRWEVRWREGGRQRSRLFRRKGDAHAFELDIKRRKQLGALAGVIQSRITLAEFVARTGGRAMPSRTSSRRPAGATLRSGARTCCRARRLRAAGDHADAGRGPARPADAREVGAPTQRKALMLLQGILRRAVVRGLIPANPVSVVDKPTAQPPPASPGAARAGDRRADPRAARSPARRDARLAARVRRPAPGRGDDRTLGRPAERTLHVHASKTERAAGRRAARSAGAGPRRVAPRVAGGRRTAP